MLRVLLVCVLACCSAKAADDELRSGMYSAEIFVEERVRDARELLLGPTRPEVIEQTGSGCATLYARRLQLLRGNLEPNKNFASDPRHAAAAFVGTIWTPAFYYLPFRAVAETARGRHRRQAAAELDQLRAASAAARCFER